MPKLHAIAYTDGSCKILSGEKTSPAGGGAHCYIFEPSDTDVKNNNTPAGFATTSLGYLDRTIDNPDAKLVKPVNYFNVLLPYGANSTSNRAELNSIIDVIVLLETTFGIEHLLIHSDSTYAIGVFKSVSNKDKSEWYNTDRVNMDLWVKLSETLLSSKVTVKIDKIKAHVDNIGNNVADRLAYSSRVVAYSGTTTPLHYTYDNKYWKDKHTPNPLLNFKQTFINLSFIPSEPNTYVVMDYPKDVELGKKTSEAIFGITILGSPDEYVNLAIDKYLNYTKGMYYLTVVDLRKIYSQQYKTAVDGFGQLPLTFNKKKQLTIVDETPIVTPVIPPGLAQSMVSKTIDLYSILCSYRNKKQDKLSVNITITRYLRYRLIVNS